MYVVTGGAGFIGSNLVRGLNRRGITDILVVDDLEQGEKHRSLNALEFTDLVDHRDFLARIDAFPWARSRRSSTRARARTRPSAPAAS